MANIDTRPARDLLPPTEGPREPEPEGQKGSRMMLLGGMRRVTMADIKNKITSCHTIQQLCTREFWGGAGVKTGLVTSCTLGVYYLSGYTLFPFTIPIAGAGIYWADSTTPKAKDIETVNKIRRDLERVKHDATLQSFESFECLKRENKWLGYLEPSLKRKLLHNLLVKHYESISEVELTMMGEADKINKKLAKRMFEQVVTTGEGNDRSKSLRTVYTDYAKTDLGIVQTSINNRKQEMFTQDYAEVLQQFIVDNPDAKNNAQEKFNAENVAHAGAT